MLGKLTNNTVEKFGHSFKDFSGHTYLHFSLGVAILSNAPDRPPQKKKRGEDASNNMSPAVTEKLESAKKLARRVEKQKAQAPPAGSNQARLTPHQVCSLGTVGSVYCKNL